MNKLKVLALSYLFPNPVQPTHGIFVYNRLQALSKKVEIKVVNPIPWSPLHRHIPQYQDLDKIPYKTQLGNLEVFHPRFFSIPKYFKSIEAASYRIAINKVLENDLKQFDFDLLDLHWTYPDLPAGATLSAKTGKPFMCTLRGLEAFHTYDSGLRKRIIRNNLVRAHKVIALSEELKQKGIELGVSEDKIRVIRNGVDTKQFGYLKMNDARGEIGLSKQGKVIVTVGSLIRRKGFDLIIRSLPKVIEKTKHSDIKLYIIGTEGPEGDYRSTLYKIIESLNLQKNVIFQGHVPNEDLKYWYNSADAFCLASRGEGSPNVLTEAIACGCPAVATDVGAVREIMESEKNLGLCVENENVQSLGDALSDILMGNFDREKSAKNYTRYDWDWCANSTFRAYQEVLTRQKKER